MYLMCVMFIIIILIGIHVSHSTKDTLISVELIPKHLDFFNSNKGKQAKKCKDYNDCFNEDHMKVSKCWGYEPFCQDPFTHIKCNGYHNGWAKSKQDQRDLFYKQADFGYLKQQNEELKIICEPLFIDDSALECTNHLRYCQGRNVMINFTSLAKREEPLRYKMDVLTKGDIGGHCVMHEERLIENLDHMSPLQSWAPELQNFIRLPYKPLRDGKCDVIVNETTYIMKIDATVNMYHHFCDFINLYMSQHLRSISSDFKTVFDRSAMRILIWETYSYRSMFGETFDAFTEHPLWNLDTFKGKNVCFRELVFPLLPRMIFGLYYNTPIVSGCQRSGLFEAFGQHVLHRLKIDEVSVSGSIKDDMVKNGNRDNNVEDKRFDANLNGEHDIEIKPVRVVFLARKTKYRRILNEESLITSARVRFGRRIDLRIVSFDRIEQFPSFRAQLRVSSRADVLVGIHGAGLTHALFMTPQWGTLFELYNCEDPNCYADLARLVGLHYVTWRDTTKLRKVYNQVSNSIVNASTNNDPDDAIHAKFINYVLDVDEFLTLLDEAVSYVERNRPKELFKNSYENINISNDGEIDINKEQDNLKNYEQIDVLKKDRKGSALAIDILDEDLEYENIDLKTSERDEL